MVRLSVIGLNTHPSSTLADRARDLLATGPQSAEAITGRVMGLSATPPTVAERLTNALLGSDPRVSRLADGRWCLVPAASASPLIDECAFAVVDVETTGIQVVRGADRVIEVAVVVTQGARRQTVLDRLIHPDRPVSNLITRITSITNDHLRAAPRFEEIADEVVEALAGRVFVAHNVRFDWSFLSAELRRAKGISLMGPRLCTARLARRLVPAAESCGLDWLTEYFGLENPARHRAGGDAWATAELLGRLLPLAREAGAKTLQDLEGLQLRRPRPARKRKRKRKGNDVGENPELTA